MPHQSAHHRTRAIHRLNAQQKTQLIKRSALAIAVIEPAMTIPQIYEIYTTQNATGVSSLTWGLYNIASLVWLLYGIQLKDKPLIVASLLWIIAQVAVLIGSLLYG